MQQRRCEPVRRPSTQATVKENVYIKALDRKKSFVIQLSGNGKQTETIDSGDEKVSKGLPKPNPKTLLDIMIGLSAFSHVPPPICKSTDEVIPIERPESTCRSTPQDTSCRNSLHDDMEDLSSQSFMQQRRKKVASRRESIIEKLETSVKLPQPVEPVYTPHRRTSTALSSASQDQLVNHPFRRRTSLKPHGRALMVPSVPAIHDKDKRNETFFAWDKEDDDKAKANMDLDCERANPKLIDIKATTRKRRESFAFWLQNRHAPKGVDKAGNRLAIRNRYEDIDDSDEEEKNIGDMMRTLLLFKPKYKDPLSKRLSRFYKDIDRIKEMDEVARRNLTSKELKRKWKMLIHGIDAALADSTDGDDDYFNIIEFETQFSTISSRWVV